MKEIKVEFHRFDNFVFGRVLSMPKELRGTGKIICDGTYKVTSYNYSPQLVNKTLYIIGNDKSRDKCYFSHNYNTISEAQLAIKAFEKLIRDWNYKQRGILDDVEKEYLSKYFINFFVTESGGYILYYESTWNFH